jgi:hypothetical protein
MARSFLVYCKSLPIMSAGEVIGENTMSARKSSQKTCISKYCYLSCIVIQIIPKKSVLTEHKKSFS